MWPPSLHPMSFILFTGHVLVTVTTSQGVSGTSQAPGTVHVFATGRLRTNATKEMWALCSFHFPAWTMGSGEPTILLGIIFLGSSI